jgi:hypothetical protein
MRWNIADFVIVCAVAGMVLYAVRLVRREERYLGPLMMVATPAFFIFSLYMGQNAIVVREGTSATSVNLRYGATVIYVLAIFTGYLAGWLATRPGALRWAGRAAAAAIAIGVIGVSVNTMRAPMTISAFQDFAVRRSTESNDMAEWMRANYDGGRILAESFGRTTGVQFASQIALREFISESSYVLWGDATRDPVPFARWALIRNNDRLDRSLAKSEHFLASYEVAFENGFGRAYKRRPDARPLNADGLPGRNAPALPKELAR